MIQTDSLSGNSSTDVTGVVLLNMGGPEQLADVGPFLFNLFSDRSIISLGPVWLQKPLARFIAHRRAPKSRKMYEQIGGGSPLCAITCEQATALENALNQHGDRYAVTVAMRYWQPRAAEALAKFQGLALKKIVLLPLYPHFSRATTGSSLADIYSTIQQVYPELPLCEVRSWPDHPLYIQALAENIQEAKKRFFSENPQIVFSAHSLPQSFIDTGDPYLLEINETLKALREIYSLEGTLSFQSRSGPVKWLEPATDKVIEDLAAKGCTELLMVPISFVSDHIETLYEINILFRNKASALGIHLECSPSLNTKPCFISCLADLVLSKR